MSKTRATHDGVTYEIYKDEHGAYWLHFLDLTRPVTAHPEGFEYSGQAVHPSEEFEYLSHAIVRADEVAGTSLVWLGESPIRGSSARILELEQKVISLSQQMSSMATQISRLSAELNMLARSKG
jgi:hypothetical protein